MTDIQLVQSTIVDQDGHKLEEVDTLVNNDLILGGNRFIGGTTLLPTVGRHTVLPRTNVGLLGSRALTSSLWRNRVGGLHNYNGGYNSGLNLSRSIALNRGLVGTTGLHVNQMVTAPHVTTEQTLRNSAVQLANL